MHISKNTKYEFENIYKSLEMFGSTSPSYLILQSLDLCNVYLEKNNISEFAKKIDTLKKDIISMGFTIYGNEPLKIVLDLRCIKNSDKLIERLNNNLIECELYDEDFLVMMFTPFNKDEDIIKIIKVLNDFEIEKKENKNTFIYEKPQQVMSIREVLFSKHKKINIDKSVGCICFSSPTSCPPAVPIVSSGELITQNLIEILKRYNINSIEVVID